MKAGKAKKHISGFVKNTGYQFTEEEEERRRKEKKLQRLVRKTTSSFQLPFNDKLFSIFFHKKLTLFDFFSVVDNQKMLGVEEDISDEDIEPKKDEEKDDLLEQIKTDQAEKEQGEFHSLQSPIITITSLIFSKHSRFSTDNRYRNNNTDTLITNRLG